MFICCANKNNLILDLRQIEICKMRYKPVQDFCSTFEIKRSQNTPKKQIDFHTHMKPQKRHDVNNNVFERRKKTKKSNDSAQMSNHKCTVPPTIIQTFILFIWTFEARQQTTKQFSLSVHVCVVCAFDRKCLTDTDTENSQFFTEKIN